MRKAQVAAHSRAHLDDRIKELGAAERFAVPVRGWIRAVRNSLGMTTEQLAKRLGVKQPTVVALEQSEAKETIELATLRRVATALDCKLVYAFVPNQPLEVTVRERARRFLQSRRAPIAHSMLLEDQAVSETNTEKRLDQIVRDINPRLLWD